MLLGYLGTNILRFTTGHGDPAWIIWCAVIAEGSAFVVNLLTPSGRLRYAVSPDNAAVMEV
jgi:hypothetical protein